MIENKYSKMTTSKRRQYIIINIVKVFLIIALIAFSDMLVISGMRTMYKGEFVLTVLMIAIRAIIVINAIIGIGNCIYQIVGFCKDKYILRKVHIRGTDTYRDVVVHVKKIPKEIVDELFK